MEIKDWNDVDVAMRKMANIDIKKANVDGKTTKKIHEIKDEAKNQTKGLDNDRKHLEKSIQIFCDDNKSEFAKKRSKELNFGKIGYRLVRSVSVPRAKDKLEKLIKNLKAFKLDTCIVYKEEIDKKELVELDDGDLVKLGLKRAVKDSFRIEPNIEKVVGE